MNINKKSITEVTASIAIKLMLTKRYYTYAKIICLGVYVALLPDLVYTMRSQTLTEQEVKAFQSSWQILMFQPAYRPLYI